MMDYLALYLRKNNEIVLIYHDKVPYRCPMVKHYVSFIIRIWRGTLLISVE